MGMFKGVENAPDFGEGGVYFKDGRYLVQVNNCKQIEAQDGREFACIETTIIRSSVTDKELQPGCEASVMYKKNRSFLSNIAHFVSVAKGIDKKDVDDDGCELIFSDENPLKDVVLRILAKTIKTREGNDFTKITFSAPDGADFDLVIEEGIVLPNGKKLKVTLREDNVCNDYEGDEDNPVGPWVP